MVINYKMLESMSNKFIPKEILSRVVIINEDSKKCERYVVNLDTNNGNNNLKHMLRTMEIEDSSFLFICIYIDVNKT